MNKPKTAITPTRAENYAEWYQQVIAGADLAENSPVRGCMVIRPWGYALWENMQRALDDMFKATGHQNAYFPLFIPLSFLEKEAAHVEGFAKECAVVTHHRLEADADGKLVPTGELEEPLVVRPTSETIIGDAFARWVQSYRDLPLLDQSVGERRALGDAHAAVPAHHRVPLAGGPHGARDARRRPSRRRCGCSTSTPTFAENWMAVPVIKGEKTAGERFPGADAHVLHRGDDAGPQGAAGRHEPLPRPELRARRAASSSSTQNGAQQHAWTTSWGVSTRLIGGLIMTHSDDDGFVLPPQARAAARRDHADLSLRRREARACSSTAASSRPSCARSATPTRRVRVHVDERDERGGEKVWQWVRKGVPMRLEIGPRDIEKDAVFVGRRDRAPKDKQSVDARGVRRDDRRHAAGDPGRAVRARGGVPQAAHARHRQQGRVLRVLREPARGRRHADADPRRASR